MTDVKVTLRVYTRFAVTWVNFMKIARYVTGDELAFRWAAHGARRLMLVKIGGDRWRFMPPETDDD